MSGKPRPRELSYSLALLINLLPARSLNPSRDFSVRVFLPFFPPLLPTSLCLSYKSQVASCKSQVATLVADEDQSIILDRLLHWLYIVFCSNCCLFIFYYCCHGRSILRLTSLRAYFLNPYSSSPFPQRVRDLDHKNLRAASLVLGFTTGLLVG